MATAAKVTELLAPSAAYAMDSPSFRIVLEDFLELLKIDQATEIRPIPSYVYYKSRFDWIGLLNEMKVHRDIHWATIRVNGGTSYTDVPKDLAVLLVPSLGQLSQIASIMNTRKRL